MAITDIFSTSLLISLAISLLLVGSVFMYFNQKIAEQNHKITSMFDLVSTMAEEVNSVKYHVQMVAGRVGIPLGMQQPTQQLTPTRQPFMNGGISQVNPNTNSNLITISEDEEEDDESDDDDDDDEDSEDEEEDDQSDDEDEDSEDDDSDDDEDNERSDDNDNQDIKINEEDSDDLDIENLENLNFESVADLPAGGASTLNDSDIKNLKKININISSNDNDNENEEEEIESEDVSDVNIKNVEVLDYKKLSLNKLRSIVTEKGVVTDASKLKKHELLKLLEVE